MNTESSGRGGYEKNHSKSENPRQKANFLSVLFFTYTIGLFKRGYRKDLEVEDLYEPLTSDRSDVLAKRLERKWKKHVTTSKSPKLLKSLISTFWPEYLYLIFLLISTSCVQILNPIALGKLLQYFRSGNLVSHEDAIWYATTVVIANTINALLVNQYLICTSHYGMRVRAACCALIYRKALKISKVALGETTSGKLVNLLSNDVSRFDLVSYFVAYMFVSPLIAAVIIYLLWFYAGAAALAGIIPIFSVVPIHALIGAISSMFRRRVAKRSDERIRLMDEIISGIQVIKMYTWEIPFTRIVNMARKRELNIISKLGYNRGFYMALNLCTSRLGQFFTLITLAMTNTNISPETVFVFMCFFNVLTEHIASYFSRGISEMAELSVIIGRIEKFLLAEEYTDVRCKESSEEEAGLVVEMKNVDVKLSEDILKDVSFKIRRGELVGVAGSVGAGKSSLLQTILGEFKTSSGKLFVNGLISYAPQEPWLFAGTIRQNILFGEKYNEKKYTEVLQACALDRDFCEISGGDLRCVGERGISLSGGQKARINLARALYRDADIYLLDDPLSAVDIHVATHIFDNCIQKYLMGKTRILVTHQIDYLKNSDQIILVNNGRIVSQGTFSSLASNSNPIFRHLLNQNLVEKERRKSVTTPAEEKIPNQDEFKEESSKGKVKGSLFFKYISAGGNVFFLFLAFLFFISAQGLASCTDYFVSEWTSQKDQNDDESNEEFVFAYTVLISSLLLIALIRSMLFFKLAARSSNKTHAAMLDAVVNTTMRFFHLNPSGRVLNRFSKDINCLDETLPKATMDAGQIILNLLGALVLVILVNPYFLVPVGIIALIFAILRVIFLKSSKNIKRLESMMRSPVFTHLNASLQGLSTIRAYEAQKILIKEFDLHQNVHTSAWFMYVTASSAFGFYLDLICCIFTALVTFSFLEFSKLSAVGKVGLAITQAISLTGVVQWGMRQSAEVANQLMSAERIFEYTQLPKEENPENPLILGNWPTEGAIDMKNVQLKYSEDGKPVLKDFSADIQPRQKIGIVGRTGAGKSSIIYALFRLAKVEGSICIDGINTKDIDLKVLRKNIAIIPQDPVLFSGSLRYNLDPFAEYPDETIWRALEEVELKNTKLVTSLDNAVMDHGSNFSVGQRQLICLARAIIRNNKILVLDEATANVDPQTDALVQKTIRKKFANCTVLTIAHRLNTIMDSDKILVMQDGQVCEFDSPEALNNKTGSLFEKMVTATGLNI